MNKDTNPSFIHSIRTRLAATCMFVLCFVSACSGSSSHTGSSGGQPQSLLPTFSDWRAAYMGQDKALHIITLDGKTDIKGPQLPFASPNQPVFSGSGIANAGFAPNGTVLAYASPSLNIIDASSGKQVDIPESTLSGPNSEAWSPDGHMLAMAGGNYDFDLTKASDGSISIIPNTPFPGSPPEANILDGWLDATHIAVDGFLTNVVGQAKVTWAVYSLDVTSGAHSTIAQISMPNNEDEGFVLSPDKTKGLFYNIPFRDYPFTPYAAEIDIATGSITPLPAIAQLASQAAWINDIAWKPGSQTVALATGFSVNKDLKNWLVDLSQDSVAALPTVGYPIKWSPDGKTLIMSSAEQNAGSIGAGPFTLTALNFDASGQATSTTLTTQAMNFNFIGFIRTANGN